MTDDDVDAVLRKMGLPHHRNIGVLAADQAEIAGQIEQDGEKALKYAHLLAQRGYATATLGDGGSRSADPTSSTERAALDGRPNRYEDIHVWYSAKLREWIIAGVRVQRMTQRLLEHAADRDEVPAGTDNCKACDRFCSPHRNPNNRIKSGFCPACYKAFLRAGRPERSEWIAERRKTLSDTSGVVHEAI